MGDAKTQNIRILMRYAVARYNQNQRDAAYRIYVTDTLRILCKMTGSYPEKRFADIIYPQQEDERTGDEIAAEVIKMAGLEVIEE